MYGFRGELHSGFCRGNLRGRGHLIDWGVDVWIILKWSLWKSVGAWSGLIGIYIGRGVKTIMNGGVV
jgi:hypothetical protein